MTKKSNEIYYCVEISKISISFHISLVLYFVYKADGRNLISNPITNKKDIS